jgi:L-aminopeptidase/D-esterase-like protein
MYDAITDVPGVLVGHAQNYDAMTGVTAILTETGAVGGIDIRGTAAGTRQADSLSALHIAGVVHGVTLAGGSAWGLSASGGVMKFLEEKGVGLDVFYAKVPIVPAAIIFDLGIGDAKVRPDEAMGYAAAAAAAGGPVAEGSIGAGTGATVGKLYGVAHAMKGGVGTAAESLDDIIVGALVVVNAFGDVLDAGTCRVIAGARDPQDGRRLAHSAERIRGGEDRFAPSGQNTTLAVLATNAQLDKREAIKIAQMIQSSLARVISPIHSTFDGDVAIVLSVGGIKRIGMNTLAMMGEQAIIRAVTNAITRADGRALVPSYSDLHDRNDQE